MVIEEISTRDVKKTDVEEQQQDSIAISRSKDIRSLHGSLT